MARIRFKCPSINRSVESSELVEENYQKSLLPERDDLLPAEEVLGCNGDVEGCETLAMEMFRKCIQVLQNDDNSAMGIDVSYPTWIGEKLMLQILPEPLLCFASGGGEVPIRPVEACAWFEDDSSTNDSTTCDSGGFPKAQVMEIDVEDLFCKPGVQSEKLLVEMSSPVDNGVDEDFKKLKVQDFEVAPVSSPPSPSEETISQKSIRGLDDAILQSSLEAADCTPPVDKSFEAQAHDSELWNFPEMPDSQTVEPCSTPVVQNLKAEYECEDLSDDLSCLLDSPGTAPSMVDNCGAPDLEVGRQPLQERGPCSVSSCNILLDDSSIDSSIRAMKILQMLDMSEKLNFIKNDRFGQSPRSKHRSCDPVVKTTSNSAVTFVDLTSADGSSPSDSVVHDIEEDNGRGSQEHRLLDGTGASLSTLVLNCEDSPCTAKQNDNSDHSSLSDEKTTCSTAPPSSFFKSDSTRSVSVLSLMNEKRACREKISHNQSSEANSKNCTPRQNSTGQGKTRLDLDAIQSQQTRGSASVVTASFEVFPWAVTAPPSSAAKAPPEHPKTEELFIEKCSGSLGLDMTKRQPLVIVAANVMQPDGPVLPRRNSSYQRILALESEQLQIVETERHLPVDLILSSSTCLIVYTAATMKLNWEKNSSLAYKECSAFIADTIINCHMKAMGFSFKKCYMVFEGEPAFTSFILQARPKLAVAAAGFGMQVQCFVSRSPQCTEGIALKCIEKMRKKVKRPYPSPMPECENDGELFLDQFPSLNPLAAHAIQCLNVPLSKFLLWSHDAMADALQGFEVPAESLKLFKLQTEHGKLKEGQRPKSTMRPEEIDFPFLPPTSSGVVDGFEIAPFNDGSGGGYRNPFFSSLDRIFDIDSLGDAPTSDEHIVLSPPFGPIFQLDPKFDEEFTPERCFNFWDGPNQLFEQEHFPVEPWLEEGPTQRPTTNGNSNRSPKPGYVQSCLDDWIEKMKQGATLSVPNSTKKEFKSEFLDLAEASIPPQARQESPFPTLNFELHGREKVPSSTVNVTPGKRAASVLDLYRHQKGISRPLQKKLKPLSRSPHLRSAVVDVSSVQAAQAHLSKRFRFKPVTNPSRFSRSS